MWVVAKWPACREPKGGWPASQLARAHRALVGVPCALCLVPSPARLPCEDDGVRAGTQNQKVEAQNRGAADGTGAQGISSRPESRLRRPIAPPQDRNTGPLPSHPSHSALSHTASFVSSRPVPRELLIYVANHHLSEADNISRNESLRSGSILPVSVSPWIPWILSQSSE